MTNVGCESAGLNIITNQWYFDINASEFSSYNLLKPLNFKQFLYFDINAELLSEFAESTEFLAVFYPPNSPAILRWFSSDLSVLVGNTVAVRYVVSMRDSAEFWFCNWCARIYCWRHWTSIPVQREEWRQIVLLCRVRDLFGDFFPADLVGYKCIAKLV